MIEQKFKTREELATLCEQWRKDGKKMGFTSGVFDILHAGHVHYLEDAKKHCDILIVGLNSDASVKKYKGDDRPLVPEDQRKRVIAALTSVDYVFIFDERRNQQNIEALKPRYYIKAGDYDASALTSKEIAEKYGGEVLLIPVVHDTSTTKLIEKICSIYGAGKKTITKDDASHIEVGKKKQERAIFLDRDGTINKDIEYLHEPDKFELLPHVIEGLKKFQEMGFKLIIVTTQAGIGLGYFTKEDFYKVNKKMFELLSKEGIIIDKVYFCPHGLSEKCKCRKPEIGLVELAKEDLFIDVAKSYFIGDKTSDVECGKRAGMKTIHVLTGHKDKQFSAKPDHVAIDLLDAAKYVLDQERK